MARWWKKLALAGCVMLLIIEAGLRWGMGFGDPPLAQLDPETEYHLVPSRSYTRFGNEISINRYGMRAADHAPIPALQERRVLVIGDSVIYGNHFLDQSQTIARQSDLALAALPQLAGCQPLTLPMAASSWGPVNQAAFLDKTGPLGAVAAAIVVSSHDLYDTPTHQSNIVPYRVWPALFATDDAIWAVISRLLKPTPPPDYPSKEAREALSLKALDQMLSQLRANEIPPVLVYHPTLPERAAGAHPARQVFADWAAQRGVRFVDLGQAIAQPGAYRDAIHPQAEGARNIAGLLARTLSAGIPPCQ